MKSPREKISIVTPSYNQGEFLEETIHSIIAQPCSNCILQYIIQDNCSVDSTHQVLKKYQVMEGGPLVHIEADTGQADALNRGFGYSDGAILGWINSDDVLLPGALESVAHAFVENPNVDVVYGDAYFIDASGVIKNKYPTANFDVGLFLNTCFLSQPSVFFRRSLYEKVGGISNDLHYCLDYNLWLKFYLAGAKFYYLRKPLSATRIYEHTKTATGGNAFVDEILQMLLNELGYVPICWKLYSEYSKAIRFYPNNQLLASIKVSSRFLLHNPGSFSEILPYVIHITKNKTKNHLTRFFPPFNKHYSDIKSGN